MTTNAPNLPPGLAYCETDSCFNITAPGTHCETCRDARLLAPLTNRQIRRLIDRANGAEARARHNGRSGEGGRFLWERVLLRLNGEAFRRVESGRWGVS